MTASSLGVRLAKEEDRDYLAGLFPSYISEWSPIVDAGVIALPMSANEDPTVAPRGAALLRYYPAADKGPAFLGDPSAHPLDDAAWLTPFDPEDIPELAVSSDDPAAPRVAYCQRHRPRNRANCTRHLFRRAFARIRRTHPRQVLPPLLVPKDRPPAC